MEIKPFAVEEWMNAYETKAEYNIAETCVDSVSLDELFEITGEDKQEFMADLCARRLTYGDIEGAPKLKEGISRLYSGIGLEDIVTAHGASGANHHLFYSLVAPGDEVISVCPTYQQLYSIPDSYGAKVKILPLKQENGFLPDLDELRHLARPGTKLICINNPNNPAGALMNEEYLKGIIEIAKEAGAWVLCDEVYRNLNQEDVYTPSMADLYEKGISTGSMSKAFSLAGLRLGWIACRDKGLVKSLYSHRDYNLISCGMLDEQLAALALSNADKILERNRCIIRENLEILDSWVQKEKKVSYVKPKAGTTALIYYDAPLESYEFCRLLLKETGAFVTPGECFDEPGCFRIGYACEKETLKEGLAQISRFLSNHK